MKKIVKNLAIGVGVIAAFHYTMKLVRKTRDVKEENHQLKLDAIRLEEQASKQQEETEELKEEVKQLKKERVYYTIPSSSPKKEEEE
mgnify:CR=1 FL=1